MRILFLLMVSFFMFVSSSRAYQCVVELNYYGVPLQYMEKLQGGIGYKGIPEMEMLYLYQSYVFKAKFLEDRPSYGKAFEVVKVWKGELQQSDIVELTMRYEKISLQKGKEYLLFADKVYNSSRLTLDFGEWLCITLGRPIRRYSKVALEEERILDLFVTTRGDITPYLKFDWWQYQIMTKIAYLGFMIKHLGWWVASMLVCVILAMIVFFIRFVFRLF